MAFYAKEKPGHLWPGFVLSSFGKVCQDQDGQEQDGEDDDHAAITRPFQVDVQIKSSIP